MMDTVGNKAAKTEIAMIKVVAPNMACQVIDWAMQVHGGAGVCEDIPLAAMYAGARTLRFADGPDEVHRNPIAKMELEQYLTARAPKRALDVGPAPAVLASVRAQAPVGARDHLYRNVEVSATRFPRKPFIDLLRHADQLRRVPARDRVGRRLAAAALRREEGRPRAAVHAEQPAVHDRVLRHPARRRGGGAGQPDEPAPRSCATTSTTAAPRWRSPRRSCCRACSRCWAAGARAASSWRPTATTLTRAHRPATCPISSRRRAHVLSRRRAASPGPTCWRREAAPRPIAGRPGRPGGDALHLGHHRPAQGLHAHAPQRDVQHRRRRAVVPGATRAASAWRCCRCSTSPACRPA